MTEDPKPSLRGFRRREALARMGAAGAGVVLGHALPVMASGSDRTAPIQVGGRDAELVLTPVSDATVRISLLPVENGVAVPVEESIVFPRDHWPESAARLRSVAAVPAATEIELGPGASRGRLRLKVSRSGRTLVLAASAAKPVQGLT